MAISKGAPRTLQLGLVLFVCVASLFAAPKGNGKKRGPALYSRDLEATLRDLLFTNYSRLQRPTERVDVHVWLTLLTINDMNIKDQTLSLSGYFNLRWRDDRLSWFNLADYVNVRNMFATQQELWRPTLVVDNSVTDLSVISNNDIPMRILSQGIIYWKPADIYVVACESDITYYPMDKQSCIISLSSWAYTSFEVALRMSSREVVTDYYSKNGEWEMISVSGDKTEASKSRGGTSFSNLKFTIVLRRRPLFHILNTLFPVVLMAFLSAMVFKLPVDSGEKIGFALTVLLAYTVYLTLISENIPSTSVTVSYLSVYLSITLSLGTLAVLCTILVLCMHYRQAEGHPVPAYVRSFTICLMRLTCWGGCGKCRCRCKRDRRVTPEKHLVINVVELKKKMSEKNVVEENEECVCEGDEEITWITLAKVLDSFFFVVFIGTILASSTAFFGVMVIEYMKIQTEEGVSV